MGSSLRSLERGRWTLGGELCDTGFHGSVGKWKEHHSGISTDGISSCSQNMGKSSRVRRIAVWPLEVADRQNGNFHLYWMLRVRTWTMVVCPAEGARCVCSAGLSVRGPGRV